MHAGPAKRVTGMWDPAQQVCMHLSSSASASRRAMSCSSSIAQHGTTSPRAPCMTHSTPKRRWVQRVRKVGATAAARPSACARQRDRRNQCSRPRTMYTKHQVCVPVSTGMTRQNCRVHRTACALLKKAPDARETSLRNVSIMCNV